MNTFNMFGVITREFAVPENTAQQAITLCEDLGAVCLELPTPRGIRNITVRAQWKSTSYADNARNFNVAFRETKAHGAVWHFH